MATRAEVLSPQHVNALNRIDIEFTGKSRKEQAVRTAWKVYLDHLGSGPKAPDLSGPEADERARQKYDTDYTEFLGEQKRWTDKGADQLVNLLSRMGELFKYDFDSVHIKKGVYQPIAHATREELQGRLFLALHDVFTGRQALGMHVMNWPPSTEEQIALTQALMSTISEGAYKVRIVGSDGNPTSD